MKSFRDKDDSSSNPRYIGRGQPAIPSEPKGPLQLKAEKDALEGDQETLRRMRQRFNHSQASARGVFARLGKRLRKLIISENQ